MLTTISLFFFSSAWCLIFSLVAFNNLKMLKQSLCHIIIIGSDIVKAVALVNSDHNNPISKMSLLAV